MSGSRAEEEEAPPPAREPEPSERRRGRAQETFTLPPDPPSDAVRFAKPRPGSRALPPPTRPNTSAAEPLTTGVVPGGPNPLVTGVVRDPKAVGPYTAELMLDGLEESRARQAVAPKQARPAPKPPVADPVSDALPDVPMPPPDTGRARPLSALPPRSSAMRPQPAARPEARPRRRNSKPPISDTAAVKRLEELLTLAEEPPEREDSASRIDLLSMSEAPPEKESTIGGSLEEVDDNPSLAARPPAAKPAGRPPAPESPRRTPAVSETEFTPLGPAFAEPGPDFNESLTSALVLLEEGDLGMLPRGKAADVEKPAPASDPTVPASDKRAANLPTALEPIPSPSGASDPLATRRLPGRADAPAAPPPAAGAAKAAPAPKAAAAPPPAEAAPAPAPAKKAKEPASLANDPTVLTPLPPAPPASEDATRKSSVDSTKLRRETYKPPPEKKGGGEKEAPGDSFGTERDYREPILAWLASLIGLVIIGGGIFIALLIAIWII